MSAARKLRRQGKIPAAREVTQQLGKAIAGLGDLRELPQAIQGLSQNWVESRRLLDALIDDYQDLAFELDMQRAVNLRLTQDVTNCFLTWVEVLPREKELRSEYVACMFLEALLCPGV